MTSLTGRLASVVGRASRQVTPALARPLPSLAAVAGRAVGIAEHPIAGRKAVVTGASSGVGAAAARQLAALGAEVVLVARREAELTSVAEEIRAAGGRAWVAPCDLTEDDSVARAVEVAHQHLGRVDLLINNAGRSIRRPITQTLDRFHDYERLMATNYFGALRLTLALLPDLLDGGGQVINVGTWGVPGGTMPRFAAYHASKAAMAAFGRSLHAECSGRGVLVSNVHLPLVATPMIAPTAEYVDRPALSPAEAAEWIITAIRTGQREMAPAYASALRLVGAFSPEAADRLVGDQL